jgi:tetratricopeptide (TPR) repeat protein
MNGAHAALAAVLLWFFAFGPALADTGQEWTACSVLDVPGAPPMNTPEAANRVVAACTARIGARDESADRRGIAYTNRANAYLMLRNYDAAIADADQSIALLPKLYIGFLTRGTAYLAQHKLESAVAEFDHVIMLKPDAATAFNNRGFTYFRLGQKERAIQDFNQAIKLSPRNISALDNRGNVYADLKQRDRALADFDATVALEPRAEGAWNDACWYRGIWGMQLTVALEACNKAVALAPKSATYLDSRGLVHFRMGDYAAAIRDCDAALAINSTLAPTRYVRGVARLRTGDKAGGEADIASARAADAKIGDTYAGYGVKP